MPEGRSFFELRGISEGERSGDREPYSADSYCAQYGVPLADCEYLLSADEIQTHGDMVRAIRIEHLSDDEFRHAALHLAVRPYADPEDWAEHAKTLLKVDSTTRAEAEHYAKLPAPIKTL